MHHFEIDLERDSRPFLRIIKLGGSLLTQAQLPTLFHTWIEDQPEAFNLIVVGGGEVVEAIRALDQIHRLDEAFVHWLCVDLMHQTAALAQGILNVDTFCQTPDELYLWNQTRQLANREVQLPIQPAIVSPRAFYTHELASSQNCTLSESWHTTSDSIAAWLARQLNAQELVLLKSPNAMLNDHEIALQAPSQLDLESISASRLVDGNFPRAAAGLHQVRIASIQPLAIE